MIKRFRRRNGGISLDPLRSLKKDKKMEIGTPKVEFLVSSFEQQVFFHCFTSYQAIIKQQILFFQCNIGHLLVEFPHLLQQDLLKAIKFIKIFNYILITLKFFFPKWYMCIIKYNIHIFYSDKISPTVVKKFIQDHMQDAKSRILFLTSFVR